MNDDLIIAVIADKQQIGIEQLEAKYSSYARKIAGRYLSCPEDAEECVNDAFLDVWNASDIKGIKNLKAFIAACVRRRAVDILRCANAQKRSKNMTLILSELEEVCDPCTTESGFESRELGAHIDSFVRALSQPDRDIFLMRYFYGMEIREIAAEKHLSRSAVDNRLWRCRKKLKTDLEGII